MTINEEPEMPFGPARLASLQEGEEWVSKLEAEQAVLEIDLIMAEGTISSIGVGAIAWSLDKTKQAIEEIKLEMMMLNE